MEFKYNYVLHILPGSLIRVLKTAVLFAFLLFQQEIKKGKS